MVGSGKGYKGKHILDQRKCENIHFSGIIDGYPPPIIQTSGRSGKIEDILSN